MVTIIDMVANVHMAIQKAGNGMILLLPQTLRKPFNTVYVVSNVVGLALCS